MSTLDRFDYRVTNRIQALPKDWQPLMSGLSFLGEPLIVLTIGLAGFISAVFKNQNQVEHAFIYSVVAFGLSTLLKLMLRRQRPHQLDIRTFGIRSYSLPSGHAFGTVMFYGLFSYLDYKYLARPWNLLIALLIWVSIFLIGISRVYLKFHYPSDVLAGWLLGSASLILVVSFSF